MLNNRTDKMDCGVNSQRLNNRFLYFSAFKLPMSCSYSDRALVNYFNILVYRAGNEEIKNIRFLDDSGYITIVHHLVINKIFKFYL